MLGQAVGYVRVSSMDQNPARQLEQVGECDKIFQDVVTGKLRTHRDGIHSLIDYVREGDTVRVPSMYRLARDTPVLYNVVYQLTTKGDTVNLISEGITVSKDKTNPTQQLMLSLLASIADFKRAKNRERQAKKITVA